jgi:hypothetical protein
MGSRPLQTMETVKYCEIIQEAFTDVQGDQKVCAPEDYNTESYR